MACGATTPPPRPKHSRCSATSRSMSPWSGRGSPACRRHCICAKKGPLALPSSKRRTSDSAPPAATSGWSTPAPGSRPTNCRAGSARPTVGACCRPWAPAPIWCSTSSGATASTAPPCAMGTCTAPSAPPAPPEPLGYARGLARAAIASGAAVYTQTAVTGARADGALWRLSTARGHSVTARQVVVATNTAQSLAPDAWPQLQRELARLPYFNVATEPLPPASPQKILPRAHRLSHTPTFFAPGRLDAGGRLVCGSVGALTPGARNAHLQWARRAIARQFPALGGIAIEHQWYGWIDTTAHHLPHLHRLAGNVWSLSGYNGRGIAPGTILGRELAWMLRGKIQPQDMSLPVTALGPIRFKRLRETFYQSGAAAAHAVGQRW